LTIQRIQAQVYGFFYPKFVTRIGPNITATQLPVYNVVMNRTVANTWQGYCSDCSPAWDAYNINSCPVLDVSYMSLVTGRRQEDFGGVQPIIEESSSLHSHTSGSILRTPHPYRFCRTDNTEVKTYDRLFFSKLNNKCFQLLTADCSSQSSATWGVYSISPFSGPNEKIVYFRYYTQEGADVIVGGDGYLKVKQYFYNMIFSLTKS